jgi:hypothetical protein
MGGGTIYNHISGGAVDGNATSSINGRALANSCQFKFSHTLSVNDLDPI